MTRHTLLLLLLLPALGAAAQDEARLSCTSIAVGRLASADGSVMTSHTCDSWYRTWARWVPAADYPRDTVTSLHEGRMHTETPRSMEGVRELGRIPQARHTYRYLDTAYPCLNEKRLAMGETTIGGRDTLRSREGTLMIEELQRLALERCATARDAIRLMGRLIKKYGYRDGGECLTIADTAEVWLFEVFGEGAGRKGGVWAAQRVPDDEVAVSANISRIGHIEQRDTARFMCSDNVRSAAKRLGLWDGKRPFSFWRAYSGGNYLGEKKNYSERELHILSTLAPGLGLSADMDELPVSARPERPVSLRDMDKLLSSYYEGTAMDYTRRLTVPRGAPADTTRGPARRDVSPRANPWMRSDEAALYLAMGDSAFSVRHRPVAVSFCAYSTVIQLFPDQPDDVGGVVWLAYDNPAESPRLPVYCGSTSLPKLMETCGQHSYRDDTALWRFRRTNRLATVRWGKSRKTIEPARRRFLDKGLRETQSVRDNYRRLLETEGRDKARAYLNDYTADFLGAELLKWDELYRDYWRQHWSGF